MDSAVDSTAGDVGDPERPPHHGFDLAAESGTEPDHLQVAGEVLAVEVAERRPEVHRVVDRQRARCLRQDGRGSQRPQIAELAHRRERAIALMAARRLDGLLMFRHESMYYLTGYDSFGYGKGYDYYAPSKDYAAPDLKFDAPTYATYEVLYCQLIRSRLAS